MSNVLEELTSILTTALSECRDVALKEDNSYASKVECYKHLLEDEIENAEDISEEWKTQGFTVNQIEAQGFLRGLKEALIMFETELAD